MWEDVLLLLIAFPIALLIAGLGNPGGFMMMCRGIKYLWDRRGK